MSPAEARVVRAADTRPREGAVAKALNKSQCPGGSNTSPPHTIEPGDLLVYVAECWRCRRCAERIIRSDR